MIEAFGILNGSIDRKMAIGKVAVYGIPYPGTFVIDRRGVVTARRFEEAYQERATAAGILGLTAVDANEGGRRSTAHLTLTARASDEAIAPGTIFSLVIDVTPRKRMHLYAPGAEKYKTISLRLDPIKGLKVHPILFPSSEVYHFAPLNERVPVYRKPFRLVQELNVELNRDGQALVKDVDHLTITGSLEYQACDDKVCFLPQSIPLQWTFKVRKLDIQRSPVRQ